MKATAVPIRKRPGFTVVELLTLLAILALAAAVLYPAVRGLMPAWRQAQARADLAALGEAYGNALGTDAGAAALRAAEDDPAVVMALAEFGGLDDPALLILPFDSQAPESLPQTLDPAALAAFPRSYSLAGMRAGPAGSGKLIALAWTRNIGREGQAALVSNDPFGHERGVVLLSGGSVVMARSPEEAVGGGTPAADQASD